MSAPAERRHPTSGSPILVGRDRELVVLREALAAALAGRGSLVLVGGEAGIGKSRLVAALISDAVRQGCLVARGDCFEADRALPYAALLDLLRTRFARRTADEIAAEVGTDATELARLLPELAVGLHDPIPGPADGPEQEKLRRSHALAAYFTRLAASAPLLVVFEDLHWADDASLEFLLRFARRIGDLPILLLLTYRTDEPHSGLRHLLAELRRLRLADDLTLAPLGRPEVTTLLRASSTARGPIDATFLEAVYEMTEGNPFFVEEILASLDVVSEPAAARHRPTLASLQIPSTIHNAIVRRVERVSAPAQQLLTLAAVAGRRFDFSLLQRLTGQEEGEVLRQIKELVSAQLVVEESAERFAFRHALTRQAIYARLLARERQVLHRTIAETIGQFAAESESGLPDLAYHCHAAGMWEESLRHACKLGVQALTIDAPQAAIEHFTRAIEATQRLGQPPETELHRARGRAHGVRGEFEAALRDYVAALAAARRASDDTAEWQGLLDLGFLWLGRDYPHAGDFFREALALAERAGDQRRIAQSLNRLGNWHVNLDQPEPGQELHRRALAIFELLDDPAGVAETLDLLGLATYFRGDRRSGIASFEAATVRYRALNNRHGLAAVLAALSHLRCDTRVFGTLAGAERNTDRARRDGEEAVTLAQATGWRPGEAYALSELAACLAAGGEYGRALTAAREGLAIAEEIEHRQWQAIANGALAMIHLDLLDAPGALRHAGQSYALARDSGSSYSISVSGSLLAAAHLLAQEPEKATALLQEQLTLEAPVASLTQSVLLLAEGELRLATGDPGQALGVADRLIAWAESAGGAGAIPALWALRGEALAALGRAGDAEEALCTARDAALTLPTRPRLWRLHLAFGRLLRSQGRRDEAEREIANGRAIVEKLAETVGDEALRGQFVDRALARFPAPRPPSPRQSEQDAFGGLTTREREVATLIARGRSNREIAAALFLSERTVETHTGHIRDKLGLTSRSQVAAWAVEHGLSRDPQ